MLRNKTRILFLAALVLVAAPIVVPSAAMAQYREFTGKIDNINKKKIILDNRMGDKLSFNKIDTTAVDGQKAEWDDLKKGDWATVSWKMMDKPRKAYKVTVVPPREDDADE